MLTDKLEPASETPGTPENEDDAADADNAVHFRVGSACDDANASAKSTSIIAMPTAFAVPPFTPANADNPWPPIVSRSTAVVVLEASASVTEPLERRSANDPPTWKNPFTPIANVPLACTSEPSCPSMSSDGAAGALETLNGRLAQSITWPVVSGRLISIARFVADRVTPSNPVAVTVPALAWSAFQYRSPSLASAAKA